MASKEGMRIEESSLTSPDSGIVTQRITFFLQGVFKIFDLVKVPRSIAVPGHEHDIFLRQPGDGGFGSDYIQRK